MRAYRIAYDGRDYRGFQRQPDVATVSDAILDALRELDVVGHEEVPQGYAAAGRTDAGVSAVAQTVAFEAPDWLRPAALNATLPADVRAWASADAPSDFHATRDATFREYTYYLHAQDADDARARETADRLAGRHDFDALTPDEDGTVRELATAIERDGPFLVLRVRAGGFPRQLVRRLAAVVERVATGAADFDLVERVIDGGASGPEGIAPAPPEPLVLTGVGYPQLSFEVDEEAASSARSVFGAQRVEHLRAAAVSGLLADLPASAGGERQRLGDGGRRRGP